MSARAIATGLLLATGAALACSNDGGIGQCFEPTNDGYNFTFPGDTLVFNWVNDQPVTVYAEPPASFQGHVDTAINVWRSAFRCGELSVSRITDSNVADIIIRNPEVMPPTSKLVFAADSVGACFGRTDIDTANVEVLRPIRAWIVPSSIADSADIRGCFRFVTAHEMGHTLGLLRHSTNPDDLMHSGPFRRVLTVADRRSIQLLYHTEPHLAAAPR